MVKDDISPIWQDRVSISFLEEAVYPKLRSNFLIILRDCAVGLEGCQIRLWFRG